MKDYKSVAVQFPPIVTLFALEFASKYYAKENCVAQEYNTVLVFPVMLKPATARSQNNLAPRL